MFMRLCMGMLVSLRVRVSACMGLRVLRFILLFVFHI